MTVTAFGSRSDGYEDTGRTVVIVRPIAVTLQCIPDAVEGRALKLPKDSDTPPYRLVAEELRRQIRSGRLKPGERVPSSRDLEATYEIANMTARSALRMLRDEGLITAMPGRGNFVADPLPEASPKAGAPEAVSGGQLPTPQYIELSERLDAINARLDTLLQVFGQLGGITETKNPPKK